MSELVEMNEGVVEQLINEEWDEDAAMEKLDTIVREHTERERVPG